MRSLFFDYVGGLKMKVNAKTKMKLKDKEVIALFTKAGFPDVHSVSTMSEGMYNAIYCAKSGEKEYVVKVAPPAGTPVLTYEKNIMRTELFWYRKIAENTDINLPKIYYEDFTHTLIPADYFVMERVKGCTLDELEMSKEEKEQALRDKAQMVSQIHQISSSEFGYIQNELYDNWYIALKSMIENLIYDKGAVGKQSKNGEKLLGYVERYKDILMGVKSSMVNFDVWDKNIISSRSGDKIKHTWIDPERSFWGDWVFDFICLEMMQPLKKKAMSIDAYNAVSSNHINLTREYAIRFALSQGLMAIIMEVEKYYRYSPMTKAWWVSVAASKMFFGAAKKVLEKG